jgi:hypothetical protein
MDKDLGVNQIIEEKRECNLKTYIAFTDFIKAFHWVIYRIQLQKLLQNRGHPQCMMNAIHNNYANTRIFIDTGSKITKEDSI